MKKYLIVSLFALLCLFGCKKKEPKTGEMRYRDKQIQQYGTEPICKLWEEWNCVPVAYEKDIEKLQAQIDCLESGGHNWQFLKSHKEYYWSSCEVFYVFKCSKCGKRKSVLLDELSDNEKAALEVLGIDVNE